VLVLVLVLDGLVLGLEDQVFGLGLGLMNLVLVNTTAGQ